MLFDVIWCYTDRFIARVEVDIHYSFIKHLKLSKVAHTLLCSGPLSPLSPLFFLLSLKETGEAISKDKNDTKKTTHQINIFPSFVRTRILLVYSLLTDTNNLTLNQAQLVHTYIYTQTRETGIMPLLHQREGIEVSLPTPEWEPARPPIAIIIIIIIPLIEPLLRLLNDRLTTFLGESLLFGL